MTEFSSLSELSLKTELSAAVKPITPQENVSDILALFSLLYFILLPLPVKQRPPMYLKHTTTASIWHLPWISHQLKTLLTPSACFWHCFDKPFDFLSGLDYMDLWYTAQKGGNFTPPCPSFSSFIFSCEPLTMPSQISQRGVSKLQTILVFSYCFISSASVWQTSGSTPKLFVPLKNLSHSGPNRVKSPLNHCAILV